MNDPCVRSSPLRPLHGGHQRPLLPIVPAPHHPTFWGTPMTEPASTGNLWPAIDRLIGPTRARLDRDNNPDWVNTVHDDTTTAACDVGAHRAATVGWADIPSLWDQLCDAVEHGRGSGTRTKPGSRPPVAVGSMSLLLAIEWEVASRCANLGVRYDRDQPRETRVPHDLRRVASEAVRQSRDTAGLERTVGSWCDQIGALLEGRTIRRLNGVICTQCQAAGIRIPNADGEPTVAWPLILRYTDDPDPMVRCAECQVCGHTFWRGEDLLELAAQQPGRVTEPDGSMTA